MDLTPFKLDIDELIDEFTRKDFTTLADMKRVWSARKFSYIYESRPSSNSALFMQSLFAHAINYMVCDGPLSRRLGGLYCLYCLYETQPYKPCFKIYLSLGELRRLIALVADAKGASVGVVRSLVKRMLDRCMFLFGFVDIASGSISQKADEISKLQEKRMKIAYDKLFAYTRIGDYIHMDLGVELGLEALKKMSSGYAEAKARSIHEATVNVSDIKHIAESKQVGDTVGEIVDQWDQEKEDFIARTGINLQNELVPAEDFELEQMLNEM